MKNILKLTLAVALAATFTSSALAFPYSQPHYGPVYAAAAPTVAVSANGHGLDRIPKSSSSKAQSKSANTNRSAQH
jgi:hypothetical protein